MKTLEGTLKFIAENDLSFDEVISRVATKGGITEEGIRVLQVGLPETLDAMFDKAIKKRNFISETVNQKF